MPSVLGLSVHRRGVHNDSLLSSALVTMSRRTQTYLIPNTNIAGLPLDPRLKVMGTSHEVVQELHDQIALFLGETLNV